jgi:hypothetical protein
MSKVTSVYLCWLKVQKREMTPNVTNNLDVVQTPVEFTIKHSNDFNYLFNNGPLTMKQLSFFICNLDYAKRLGDEVHLKKIYEYDEDGKKIYVPIFYVE